MPSDQFKTNVGKWLVRGLYAAGATFASVAGYGILTDAGTEWPQYAMIFSAAAAGIGKLVSVLTEKSKG